MGVTSAGMAAEVETPRPFLFMSMVEVQQKLHLSAVFEYMCLLSTLDCMSVKPLNTVQYNRFKHEVQAIY